MDGLSLAVEQEGYGVREDLAKQPAHSRLIKCHRQRAHTRFMEYCGLQ